MHLIVFLRDTAIHRAYCYHSYANSQYNVLLRSSYNT